MTDLPVIDYRGDGPIDPMWCSVCGAPVEWAEEWGTVYLTADDVKHFARHGDTVALGANRTVSERYWCSADPDHNWGPILLA